MRNKKSVFAFVLTMCLLFICFAPNTYVYASDGGDEILTVNAAWLDGEMLRINVTDAKGVKSSLALNLTDYVSDAENNEYISIQAVDLSGNKSGIVKLKNPYYIAPDKQENAGNAELETDTEPETETDNQNEAAEKSQSGIPDINGLRPFTTSGAGTIIDNATSGDGKEFFTINSENGNEFYLIIDRQKNFDNVYLLNAVTEQDLIALAEKNGQTINVSGNTNDTEKNGSTSGISVSGENSESGQSTEVTPTLDPESKNPVKNSNNILVFALIAALAVGSIGYYLKIVKGKKNSNVADDDDDFEYENDEPEEADDDFNEYESLEADEEEGE